MSLDNIQLPPIVLEHLFRKSLVDLKINEPESGITNSIPFKFLGNNTSAIAIIVNSKTEAYLPVDELSFLTGVLSACNLTLSDIALINMHTYPELNYTTLTERMAIRKIILFGITATQINLPFTIPNFQVQRYDGRQYLLSPAINTLIDNKPVKKKLWDSLKALFEMT